MKKIYINRTKRALVFGNVMLLPGSNVKEAIDEKKNPLLKAMIDEGDVEITEDAAMAVRQANTQKTVDEILALAPKDEKAKKAGSKRKDDLDELDKLAAEALKNQNKGEDEDEVKDGEVTDLKEGK